jgi:hypothetical protein
MSAIDTLVAAAARAQIDPRLCSRAPRVPAMIMAVDVSNSTASNVFYFERVRREAEAALGETRFVVWGTVAREVSRAELLEICDARCGRGGGTDPLCVAAHLRSLRGWIGERDVCLVLVTDGQVSPLDIDACDVFVRGQEGAPTPPPLGLEYVRALLVYTGGEMNMSVTAPFARACPHVVLRCTPGVAEPAVETHVSRSDLQILDALAEIQDADQLLEAAPALERALAARLMGRTGDAELRAQLLAMQARVSRDVAARAAESGAGARLVEALRARDADAADACARQLTTDAAGGLGADVHRTISLLLRYTEGALRAVFSADAIRSHRAAHAAMVVPPAVAPVEPVAGEAARGSEAALAAPPFECPVSYEAETPVLLLAEDTPLLATLEAPEVSALLDNPLAILRMPRARDALLRRLDHPVGLGAFRTGLERSPFTRAPLMRVALCLGAAPDHARATTAALYALVAGGRRLGSADLWFAAIVLALEVHGTCEAREAHEASEEAPRSGSAEASHSEAAEASHSENEGASHSEAEGASRSERSEREARLVSVERFASLLPAMREHLRWRMQNHRAPASLSGLAHSVTTRVPLFAALWFCSAGAAAQNDVTPRREAARAFMGTQPALARLLEIAVEPGAMPYPVSQRAASHLRHLRALLCALALRKLRAGAVEPSRLFRERIRALTQRSARVRREGLPPALLASWEGYSRVFLDGAALWRDADAAWHELPEALRCAGREAAVALAALVSAQSSAGDVGLASDWAPPEHAPVARVRWPGDEVAPPWCSEAQRKAAEAAFRPAPVEIVAATMRPRYLLADGRTWREAFAAHYASHPQSTESFSTTRWYMNCLCTYGVVPTRDLFLVSADARARRLGETLPALICADFETQAALHREPLRLAGSVAEAVRRYKASASVPARVRLERTP